MAGNATEYLREVRRDERPLVIGHIGRVRFAGSSYPFPNFTKSITLLVSRWADWEHTFYVAVHSGGKFNKGDVFLAAPNSKAVEAANRGNPEDAEWRNWREQATTQDDIYYFAIHLKDVLVGELFLHDINLNAEEAMLGYRIFSSSNRGRGIGKKALQLLQDFVANKTTLKRLVIITAEENTPSRRIAEHCGFELVGSARENSQLVVYEWKSPPAKM